MKILINVPPLDKLGGVSNHYKGLKPYWSKDVKYFCIGARKWRTVFFSYYLVKFFFYLIIYRPDVVMLNPSMARKAIKRDFIYMKIAELFQCKIVIMFHGFHVVEISGMEHNIADHLNRCCMIYVLSEDFKRTLQKWGVKTSVVVTTTKVSDDMIKNFNIAQRKGEIRNILFLARVTKEKGIFVAIDVFKQISMSYQNIHYTVVGSGEDFASAKEYADEKRIPNLRFTGALSGEALIKEFINADM